MPAFRFALPGMIPRRLFRQIPCGLAAGLALNFFARASSHAELPTTQPSLKIAYLAELPISWRTGLADPIRNMARSLGAAFARPVDPEFPEPADNVFGAESWEELQYKMQLGNAELFPIQAYELVEHERALNLKPLLLATRNGRWQTRFLLLAAPNSEIQSLHDLKDRTILVHRDGCGNLVDFWLDAAIAKGTGTARKSFARYQTVTQAREAVLPVFFGEADACVVSESAYQAVCAQNPGQIIKKLNDPLVTSDEFPTQVVACRVDWPVDLQRLVVDRAAQLTWEFGDQTGGLITAQELAFDHLRTLLRQRANPGEAAPVPAPRPPASRLQTSAPAKRPAPRP